MSEFECLQLAAQLLPKEQIFKQWSEVQLNLPVVRGCCKVRTTVKQNVAIVLW